MRNLSIKREAQLRLEKRSLMLQPNPNWDAILEKEQELAKIRVELMKKAHDKGLPLGRFGMWRKYCVWQNDELLPDQV